MNQPSSFKTIHAIGVALAAAMAAVFLWSTLGAAAFNGPTQNPSGGNGAISTDASNNVYIGGNLNVTGTITGSGLGGSTISAGNVSAGDFGSNTGGGTYAFPGLVYIGASSTAGDYETGLVIEDTANSPGQGLIAVETNNHDYSSNDYPGDLIIGSLNGGAVDLNGTFTVASSGNVGIGTTTPSYPLTVVGTSSASAYCISGANCITAWPGG